MNNCSKDVAMKITDIDAELDEIRQQLEPLMRRVQELKRTKRRLKSASPPCYPLLRYGEEAADGAALMTLETDGEWVRWEDVVDVIKTCCVGYEPHDIIGNFAERLGLPELLDG